MSISIHESAVVDQPCAIGEGTRIWHFVHVCEEAEIGENCRLGQNVMIGRGVKIGNNVKIQNNVSVYSGTIVEDDVFLGPSCVLTNISNPRAEIVRHDLFEETRILRGATVGANATVVSGITLGRYCFVAAGAVVKHDVPDYGLVVGVPGKHVGWMSRHGHKLTADSKGRLVCPESGWRYEETEQGDLRCLDFPEDKPLPLRMRSGSKSYREFKESDER